MTTTSTTAPAGMHTITPHIVVRDAAAASEWYQRALGAVESARLPLPNGRLMYVEFRIGDSSVMAADEFPEFGIVSPLALGGTAVVLHVFSDDVDSMWQQAVEAGAEVRSPSQISSGAAARARSSTRSGTDGTSPSTCATFHRMSWPQLRPRCSHDSTVRHLLQRYRHRPSSRRGARRRHDGRDGERVTIDASGVGVQHINAFMCVTCGTQFAPSADPPDACPICLDERQYKAHGGQQWATLEALRHDHAARVEE